MEPHPAAEPHLSVDDLAALMEAARREVAQSVRGRCRAASTWEPNVRDLITALVLMALTGDEALSEYFLMTRGREQAAGVQNLAIPSLDLDSVPYLLERPGVGQAVARAITEPSSLYRSTAERFLVNSFLAKFVMEQSQKGVVVSTAAAIDTYLLFWADRPQAPRTRRWLQALMHHKTTRRNFAALMRAQWGLDYGAFKERKVTAETDDRRKVRSGTHRPRGEGFLDPPAGRKD